MEYRGIDYLRSKMRHKLIGVNARYNYYEMHHTARDLRISTPPQMIGMVEHLGWCAKAVDALADRLQFQRFDYDDYNMAEIYGYNNADVLYDSAILSALIGGCAFLYIVPDDTGYPRMQVIDGRNATGIIDSITGYLTEGYAVLDADDNGTPTMEAYFTADATDYYTNGQYAYTYANPASYPLLVPLIHRPDAKRPFGHSRITRACMDLVDGASRTLKRSEISAEFYSFPQKYVLGLSDDVVIDNIKAAMSYMMTFGKDDDGETPKVGQFTQQSMGPHIEQMRMFASAFAGETGLTLDDLGFPSDNPSSSEAIKASHENLRLAARKAQRTFASGFINAGLLAACVRDDFAYQRQQVRNTRIIWEPIFEPDAAMLSGIGDGINKINQAVPGYFGADNLRALTGVLADTEQAEGGEA